jgi:hypothetical protein
MTVPIPADADENEDRIIDRSGDIDQRPPEERGLSPSNIVLFQSAPQQAAGVSLGAIPRHDQEFTSRDPRRPPEGPAGAIALRLQKDLDSRFARAKAQLEALTHKIEIQERRWVSPKLDDDLQQVRLQRQKVLIANGPELANRLGGERSHLADLDRFKATNGLSREAHYPASPTLGIGILAFLILLEAAINGVLFAETSDQGLFGGWLEALVLSITNVGAAFLLGRLLLPQLHRRGFVLRLAAAIITLAGVFALVSVNLIGAHYRDFRAEFARADLAAGAPLTPRAETAIVLPGPRWNAAAKPTKPGGPDTRPAQPAQPEQKKMPTEREAIRKALQAPLDLQSFTSVFLLVIGLCGATVAVWDGYKFDDPYPGYGKRHRRYLEARGKSTSALRKILLQSNTIMEGNFQAIARKIENHAQEMATLLSLHHAYAGELKALKGSLDEAARNAEHEIGCHQRLANKLPDREALGLYTLSMNSLPELSDKHAKFYEAQERKLKALQKSAHRERDDALGVFDGASVNFQKLLTEASQTSLQAVSRPDTGERS